jgi:hypothetical protein
MTDQPDADVDELSADIDNTIRAFIKSHGSVRADIIASAIWHTVAKFLLAAPDHETCKLGIEAMREELQNLYDEVERRRVQPEAGLQ